MDAQSGLINDFTPPFEGLKAESTIYLESAVFVFHMSRTTPESSGHREPRVLSPSNGFWLAPSANQNRRPKHAGVPDTLARS